MIPVAPLIWVAILAYRYFASRKSGDQSRSLPSGIGDLFRWTWVISAWVLSVILTMAIVLALWPRIPVPLGITAGGVAFAVSACAVTWGPIWLAWRIARPLGLAWLSRAIFFWSPLPNAFDRAGYHRLLAANLGRPMPRAGKQPEPVNAWCTCAAALQAERVSDPAHADRLVRALRDLPKGARFPRSARTIAMEALCWAAAARGDWDAVGQRADLGRGRGVWPLRLLAAAHTRGGVSAARLWTAWLFAPSRRKGLALVKAALRAEPPRVEGATPALHPLARRGGAHGLHLALLAEGASGRRIPAPAVARLVGRWEKKLGALDEARIRARGLELGARDAPAAAAAIRRSVLEQLEVLAAVTGGALPELDGRALGAELKRRSRDRLFAALDPFLARSRADFKDLGGPMQEWEQWLRFREAVEALAAGLGVEGLRTAWHAGVRTAAWNWPCKLLNASDQWGAWACQVMFAWVASLAETVGDTEAATINRKNTATARSSAAAV